MTEEPKPDNQAASKHRNLTSWDAKTARIMGQRGGRRKTLRKQRASRVNPIKHGKYAKSKEALELHPNQKEKAIGITFEDKLAIAKQSSMLSGSSDIKTAADALRYYLFRYEARMLTYYKALEKKSQKLEREGKAPLIVSPFHEGLFFDRAMSFAETIHGLGPRNNLSTLLSEIKGGAEITFRDILIKVLGTPEEGTEAIEADFRTED